MRPTQDSPGPVAWLRNLTDPSPHAVTDLKYRSAADADTGVAYIPVWAGGSPSAHADDVAIDVFAAAMKSKMARSREKGRGGWQDPAQCSGETLARMLVEHLAKGNPGSFEDVANFAMMLHHRGEDPALLKVELERHKETFDHAAP